jgi:hypothetical protein
MGKQEPLNWSFIWHLASVVNSDKEFTLVVVELPDHSRYVVTGYTERDDELVLLVREETELQ